MLYREVMKLTGDFQLQQILNCEEVEHPPVHPASQDHVSPSPHAHDLAQTEHPCERAQP